MRNIFLFLLVISSFRSSAQIPIDSFYTDGTTWTNINDVSIGAGSRYYYEWTEGFEYKVDGDTNISGKTYRKLYYRSIGKYGYKFAYYATIVEYLHDTTVSPFKYIGELRIDSSKVYFTNHFEWPWQYPDYGSGVEKLLYNFDRQIGDTSNLYFFTKQTITSIDSILIGGRYLKRYYLNNSPTNYEIEGIGYMGGFLGMYTTFRYLPFKGDVYSLCYQSPSMAYKFPVPDVPVEWHILNNCFDMHMLSTEKHEMNEAVTIYPNPASNAITIKGKLKGRNAIVTISNSIGQAVYRSTINVTDNTLNEAINISGIAAGVYSISITAENENLLQKIVIQ